MRFIHTKKLCLAILLLISATQACTNVLYLQAKQYLDVHSGTLIAPTNIVIENGTIAAINPLHAPDGATVISRPELTLLPGLMDMHVHLLLDSPYYPTYQMNFVQDDAGMASMRAVKNAKILLMSGFTTIRCVGQFYYGTAYIDVAVGKAGDSGWIAAPHIFSAGNAIGMTGGSMDYGMMGGFAPGILGNQYDYRMGIADGVDEVIKSTRYQIKHGAKVIKIGATDAILAESDDVTKQEYNDDELKAIVDEAHRHDLTVAAHAHGANGIKAAIRAGVDSIEHGSLLDDEGISLMKEHHTYLVPTTYIADSININQLSQKMRKKAEYIMPIAKRNLSKAIHAGVPIAFGTDSPVIPHGDNAKEFAALVRRGMPPIDAIRTATINAADLLRLKDRGQIKAGFDADIIGVHGDPLANIEILERVHFVMKDGEVFKG